MINKKIFITSLGLITPDQQDVRGHCLFDRNKQKNKINNIRTFKNEFKSNLKNYFLLNFKFYGLKETQ
jgi:hypothetical protein